MQIKVITRLSGYFFVFQKGETLEKIQGGLPKSTTSCRKGNPYHIQALTCNIVENLSSCIN